MARNNSRGTATSAIWKMIFREWRTTFAPLLISFSRNVTTSVTLVQAAFWLLLS
jgi:hypothetical protein